MAVILRTYMPMILGRRLFLYSIQAVIFVPYMLLVSAELLSLFKQECRCWAFFS